MGLFDFLKADDPDAPPWIMKALRRSVNDPWFVAMMGVFVLLVSLAGVWHCARAGMAQQYYYQAKYGKPAADTEQVLEYCKKAYALYPDNYYFSILASEKAYYMAGQAEAGLRQRRLEQSAIWCERGLVQNGMKGQLRRIKARFLWETSPSEAIRFWKAYTEWQFWEPYNHAVLAGMYAKAGDFENAERALTWTDGSPEGEEARRIVEMERKEWKAILGGETR